MLNTCFWLQLEYTLTTMMWTYLTFTGWWLISKKEYRRPYAPEVPAIMKLPEQRTYSSAESHLLEATKNLQLSINTHWKRDKQFLEKCGHDYIETDTGNNCSQSHTHAVAWPERLYRWNVTSSSCRNFCTVNVSFNRSYLPPSYM